MGGRVLTKDEFVARMSVRLGLSDAPKKVKKKSKKKGKRMSKPELPVANRTGSNRGMYKARPLRRDDGKLYPTISAALLDAGYSPGGATTARDRINRGATWKDGHRYEFI